jgi:GTP-dependent phosphoenolpyruvate carboxykinase
MGEKSFQLYKQFCQLVVFGARKDPANPFKYWNHGVFLVSTFEAEPIGRAVLKVGGLHIIPFML